MRTFSPPLWICVVLTIVATAVALVFVEVTIAIKV